MKKHLNSLSKTIITVTAAAVLFLVGSNLLSNPYKFKATNTEVLERIAPKLNAALTDADLQLDPAKQRYPVIQRVVENLMKDQVIVNTPFGPIFTGNLFHKEYTILIDSNGGKLSNMLQIEGIFAQFIKRGITFKCYIANAQSAAFYLALRICSNRILIKGAKMMQHFPHVRGVTSSLSYLQGREMACAEARSLLMDCKKWFEISRLRAKDKVFTEEELLKYGVIHKVIDK